MASSGEASLSESHRHQHQQFRHPLTIISAHFCTPACTANKWTTSNIKLPRSSEDMAIGSYVYDISTHKMTDSGSNHLVDGVTGDGQFFCVTNHTMYIMDLDPNSHLSIFDLKTAIYSAKWHNEASSRPGCGGSSCLTSSDMLLFVLGGIQASKSLQMLSLDTWRWYIDTLDMQHNRAWLTCMCALRRASRAPAAPQRCMLLAATSRSRRQTWTVWNMRSSSKMAARLPNINRRRCLEALYARE